MSLNVSFNDPRNFKSAEASDAQATLYASVEPNLSEEALSTIKERIPDALVSHFPPLAVSAEEKISEIKNNRLNWLKENDVSQEDIDYVLLAFNYCDEVRPLASPYLAYNINLLYNTDLSEEEITKSIRQDSGYSNPYPGNEIGFASVLLKLKEINQNTYVDIDVVKLWKNIEHYDTKIAGLCFGHISDAYVRKLVAQDIIQIFRLRMDFDLALLDSSAPDGSD